MRQRLSGLRVLGALVLAGCVQNATLQPQALVVAPVTSPNSPTQTPPKAETPVTPFSLSDKDAQALGYLKVGPGGILAGTASGPERLVANGAAGLIANGAAGLIANGAAGLIANGAAGLIANGAAGRTVINRLTHASQVSLDYPVADGWVALSSVTGALLARLDGRPYGGLTDASGSFRVEAPKGQMVVTVLLEGNRRLSALAQNDAAGARLTVDVGTTLVTEHLRDRLRRSGKDLGAVFAANGGLSQYAELVNLTNGLLRNSELAGLAPADLTLDATEKLNQRYALAVGRDAGGSLGRAWVDMMKRVLGDAAPAEDLLLQPLALETSTLLAPESETSRVLAYDPVAERMYLNSYGVSTETLLALDRDASASRQVARRYKFALNGMYDVQAILPFGRQGEFLASGVFGDLFDVDADIGIFGLVRLDGGRTYLPENPELAPTLAGVWSNASLLMPRFDASGSADPATRLGYFVQDLALDRPDTAGATGTLYVADSELGAVRVFAMNASGHIEAEAGQIGAGLDLAKKAREQRAAELPLAGSLADLYFMAPTNVTLHQGAGARTLYITDTESGVVVAVDLDAGRWKRIAGKPAPAVPALREKARVLALDPETSVPVDDGRPAVQVALNYPHKVVIDGKNRLFIADSDHLAIRMIRLDDPQRRIWTIAGNLFETAIKEQPEARARLARFTAQRSVQVGDGESRVMTLGEVNSIALDGRGDLHMTDDRSRRVRILRIGDRP